MAHRKRWSLSTGKWVVGEAVGGGASERVDGASEWAAGASEWAVGAVTHCEWGGLGQRREPYMCRQAAATTNAAMSAAMLTFS